MLLARTTRLIVFRVFGLLRPRKTEHAHGPQGWSSIETPSGRHPPPKRWPTRQQLKASRWCSGWPSVTKSWKSTKPATFQRRTQTRLRQLHEHGWNVWTVQLRRGIESTEAKSFQNDLEAARRAAQERPATVQVEERQAFVKRSHTRLRRLEEERVAEQKEFDARLSRLKEEIAQTDPPRSHRRDLFQPLRPMWTVHLVSCTFFSAHASSLHRASHCAPFVPLHAHASLKSEPTIKMFHVCVP